MTITILIALGGALALAVAGWIIFLPRTVEYIERITVHASVGKVYDAIRFQEQLMRWSAWPAETNSLCEVNETDGQPGAQTIYKNPKGKQFGYQEITGMIENERVDFYLKSFVAPFEEDVRLTFLLLPRGEHETEVMLWFREKMKKPLFLVAYFGGILKWVRRMHLKDLAGLKKFVEA